MSLLNLNIEKAAGPGRRAVPVDVEYVRDVTEADLELLATRDAGSKPAPLQKVTDRHHALARLLSSGVGEGEAALILGMSNSRVSVLKETPAFKELLGFYRKEVDLQFASVLEHMSGLSKDALLELRDRLEDNPGGFSNSELLRITTEMVDRSADARAPTDAPTEIVLTAYDPSADSTST